MGFFRESWHHCRAPRWGMCALLLCLTAACGGRPALRADAEILVIGDSILAFHSFWGASVGDAVAEQMGVPVENRAVSGARFTSTSARVAARPEALEAPAITTVRCDRSVILGGDPDG